MRRLSFVLLALVCVVVLPVGLSAHEGHDHKVLGTVVSVDAKHLVVKTTEGPEKTVAIVAATTFHRGKDKGFSTEVKAGMRVVVNVGAGKEPLTAKDIQYPAAAATK